MDCQWNISSNAALELAFYRFNTQPSADYVRVYNGGSPSSPLIGRFSGSSLPAPITTLSNELYVKFTSDGSGTYQGFRARYRGMTSNAYFKVIHRFVSRKTVSPFTPKSAKFKTDGKILNLILQNCQKQTVSYESTAQ